MEPTNWLQIKDQWKHLRDIFYLFLSLEKEVKLTFSFFQIITTCCFLWKRFVEATMNLVPDCVHCGGQQLVPLVRLRDMEQVTLVTWTPIAYSSQSVVREIWTICLNNFGTLRLLGSHRRWSNHFPPDEKLAFDKVNESVRFDGEGYGVAVPWKHERPELRQTGRWQRNAFTQLRRS